MAAVETVSGQIDAGELGTTLVHEHLFFRDEAVTAQWPHSPTSGPVEPHGFDADGAKLLALESARAALDRGVRTICDPTCMFGGRDVRLMREVAGETGLQVVACTGIYTYDFLPHFFDSRDADAIADLFVHDIERGIQGTEAKAAFLKCAADEPGITANVEKVHRAAARAHRRTGVPIMAHSRPASGTGPTQLDVFADEGVDLERVQVAHTGDTDDLDYIERILERGAWIGMDRYGLEMFLPIERRNATVLALLERGYAERMLLSHDYCATIDWYPPEAVPALLQAGAVRNWSMTLVFDEVLPALRQGGATDDQIETLMVANPRRWLAGG